MPPTVASADLTDDAFLSAFHHCELPLAMFRHGDHLRFAWLTLHRSEFEEALQIVQDGIQRFAEHHELSQIFHKTVTIAWVHLLASHREPTFAAFLMQNEDVLTADLLHRFWTPAALKSAKAKCEWLPPDRAPLPEHHHLP